VAKKAKKKVVVRREYTRAEVKELRAHSKARTPVAKIAKLTKRWLAHCDRRHLRSELASATSVNARG
jgi:hypothetical protein